MVGLHIRGHLTRLFATLRVQCSRCRCSTHSLSLQLLLTYTKVLSTHTQRSALKRQRHVIDYNQVCVCGRVLHFSISKCCPVLLGAGVSGHDVDEMYSKPGQPSWSVGQLQEHGHRAGLP